jgi:site-specific recombinase XerC
VKQQLAAVRMLFDWLITGQVVPHNPACQIAAAGLAEDEDRASVVI